MAYTREELELIWSKAKYVNEEYEKKGLRTDICGAWIQRTQYSNGMSDFGWKAVHNIPWTDGGPTEIENLQPLHLQNNANKGDKGLVCAMTSQGSENVAVK